MRQLPGQVTGDTLGYAGEAAFLKKAPPQTPPGKHFDPRIKQRGQAQFPECSVVHRTCQSPSVTFGKQFIFQEEVFGLRMQEALLKGELSLKATEG